MKKSELEDRLVRFSTAIIRMTKGMVEGFDSQHLGKQIIRSGTAVSLLYGEAQGAATKKDFIHKISLVLRELRETHINLKLINNSNLFPDKSIMADLMDENHQLISIFMKTYLTCIKNEGKKGDLI
jgi:four helix bundle protein